MKINARQNEIRWGWVVAVLVGWFLLVAAIILPVLDKRSSREIFVFDSNGNPVSRARLTFRNNSRWFPKYTIFTDDKGMSHDRYASRIAANIVGEYALQYVGVNTKRNWWVFSTRGTQTFIVKDDTGRPLPNVDVYLLHPTAPHQRNSRNIRPSDALANRIYRTDQQGVIPLSDIALAQRFQPEMADGPDAVQSVHVTTGKDWVHYEVHVASSLGQSRQVALGRRCQRSVDDSGTI
jgi:hypothetical protein